MASQSIGYNLDGMCTTKANLDAVQCQRGGASWQTLVMLLTQQLVPALGYSIEMPIGWTVIVDTSSGFLRAVLGGTVSHREAGSAIEPGDADFCLAAISPGTTLEAYAEARMKRHVPQGEPERFADVIGGHPALGYTWTDGVRDIATWFVEPLPSTAVRIDHSIPGIGPRVRSEVDARSEGLGLLATLNWVVPRT